ncbi:MAG: IS200/IS605 family transposase [Candidatus Margulisbacteria bacterium]|nr:IS200/IS605 family transposase [Candidatus Margulisiibacteriota bacterium]
MAKTFHYTFRTYKKMQVLEGEIAKDLGIIFDEVCKTKGFELIAFNVLVDHVHILLRKGLADSNEYVMKMVKGISSRELFKKYPGNRFEFRKLWGRGYHAVEVKDQEDLKTKIDYINNQMINGIDKRALRGRKPRSSFAGFLQPLGSQQ